MRVVWVEVALFLILGGVGLLEGMAALGRKAFQQEPLAPGAYLIVVAAALCVATVIYAVSARRKPETPSRPARFALGRQSGLWALMVGYAVLLPVLGYALSTLAFFAVAFYLLGIRPWARAGLSGLAFSAVFFVGFVMLANLLLPSGLVGVLADLVR